MAGVAAMMPAAGRGMTGVEGGRRGGMEGVAERAGRAAAAMLAALVAGVVVPCQGVQPVLDLVDQVLGVDEAVAVAVGEEAAVAATRVAVKVSVVEG